MIRKNQILGAQRMTQPASVPLRRNRGLFLISWLSGARMTCTRKGSVFDIPFPSGWFRPYVLTEMERLRGGRTNERGLRGIYG